MSDLVAYEALVDEETACMERIETFEAIHTYLIDFAYAQGERLHLQSVEKALHALVSLEHEERITLSHARLHKARMAAVHRGEGGSIASCPPRYEN